MEPSAPLPVVTREARERTIRALCTHFAQDNLGTEELERRLELAWKANAPADLEVLLNDLPAVGDTGATAAAPAAPAPAPAGSRTVAHPHQVSENSVVVAIMGGAVRKGQWTPARQNFVVAMMGGVELDFREARFGPGITEVTVFAMMGGCEVTVPPDLPFESHGIGIMGGFDHRAQSAPISSDPEAPRLRIQGLALMGGVEIDVRLPGETKRDARSRAREQRRELRDEARRLRDGMDR